MPNTHTHFPSCVYPCLQVYQAYTSCPEPFCIARLWQQLSNSLLKPKPRAWPCSPFRAALCCSAGCRRKGTLCLSYVIVYLLLQTLKSRGAAFIRCIIRLCYCFHQTVLKPFCGGCSLGLLCNIFFSCFYVSVCLSASCGDFKDTTGEIISAVVLPFVD